MQTDFFGTVEDKKLLLDFIFSETNYLVFDHYSEFGEELQQYFSTAEILEKFDLENGSQYHVMLGLWNPSDKTKNIIRKVILDPKYCKGHSFRYTSSGWGIQRLYFGGIENGFLNASQCMGFNEKGALAKDFLNPACEKEAHQLDWKLIRSDQRILKNYIEKKLGVEKHKRGIVLRNAHQRIINKELQIR